MRRLLRGLAVLLTIAVVLAALAVAAAVVGLRTAAGQRWARTQLVTLLEHGTQARVVLGAVRGSVVRSVVVEDLAMTFAPGTGLHVRRANLRWSPWALLRGVLRVDLLAVDGLRVRATHTAEGWGLPPAPPEAARPASPSRWTLELGAVRVRDGRLAAALLDAAPARRVALAALELDGRARLAPGGLSVGLERLTAVPRGVALTPLSASGTLSIDAPTGIIEVDDLVAATRRSRLAAQARVAPGHRAVARIDLAPIDAAEVRSALPGLALRTDVRGSATIAGAWSNLGFVVRLDLGRGGTLGARGGLDLAGDTLGYRVRASLGGIDPGAILDGLPGGRLQGAAGIAGRGVDTRAVATYRAQLERSELAGRELRRLRLLGQTAGGHHVLRARAVLPAATAAIQARGVLRPTLAYRARSRVRVDDLSTLFADTPGQVRAQVSASGRGTAAEERRANVRLEIDDSVVRGVAIRDGRATARLRGDRLVVDGVRLQGPSLAVDGSGSADLAGRTLEARARASADLAAVRPPPTGGLAGRVTLEASAGGSLDALAATARIQVLDLRAAGATAGRILLAGRAERLGAADPGATAGLDASGIRLAGDTPWSGHADVTWAHRHAADTARVVARGSAERGAQLEIAMAATREPQAISVQVERLAFAPPGGQRWTLTAPTTATVAGDVVTVPWLAMAAGGQRLVLWGHAGRSGAANAGVDLSQVALQPLCALAERVRCGGNLSGSVRVTGTAAEPFLRADVRVPGLTVDDVHYGELGVHGEYAARLLEAHAALAYPRAGVLELDARVPVDLAWAGPRRDLRAAPLSARLHAERLDLRFVPALAPGVLRELDGRLSADLEVHGPLEALTPSGTAELTADRLLLVATGVPWEAVVLRLRAQGDGVAVETLAARAGDGTATGEGRIGIRAGRPGAVSVQVRMQDFLAVRQPAYEAAIDGQLALGGTVTAPTVDGAVAVDRAIVRPGLLPTSAPNLKPDATIQVIGLPPSQAPPPEEGPGLMQALRLAIRVHIARDAWIRRADAQIELAGDLRVDKQPDGPVQIGGMVRLVRGWYAFQGRRFELEQGSVVFDGHAPPDPSLSVVASHTAGEYHVTVEIGGTASKPTLQLSSDPPLEQADILSVLLFGKPTTELGRGESLDLQRQALSLASGYVMPELQASLIETLGLDTLDVGPEGVRAGRYLTQDVFVSIAQDWGTQAGQTGQSVAIEYSLTPRLSVRGSTSTIGTSALDLLWHRRY